MTTEKERFYTTYSTLLKKFLKEIKGIDTTGIPEPHLPCIGADYLKSKYKLAFFGKETNGWGALKDFILDAKVDLLKALQRNEGEFDDLAFVDWTNNFKTSFWDFILKFLSVFYCINDVETLKNNKKYHTLLRSFIWGNTNSIERYEKIAKRNPVLYDNWKKIKESSSIFDNPKYILEIYKPNILFILNRDENEEWLTNTGNISGPDKVDENIHYYYKSNTKTHVLWLVHPRWAAPNIGFEKYIDQIIRIIKTKKVLVEIPSNDEYSSNNKEIKEERGNIMIEKREYLYRLSKFLKSENKVMSGSELVIHFNRNNILTEYGTQYGGGRGIYTLLRSTWNYYMSIGQKKKAKVIAESFVNESGDYAYE